MTTATTHRIADRIHTQRTSRRSSQASTTQPTTIPAITRRACMLLVAVSASDVLVMKKNPNTTARNAPGSAPAMRSDQVRPARFGVLAVVIG
jgi:hypothetical protein